VRVSVEHIYCLSAKHQEACGISSVEEDDIVAVSPWMREENEEKRDDCGKVRQAGWMCCSL